jgi:UDP-glucose 4-epimerase
VVIVDNLDNSSLCVLENISKILGYKPDFYEVDIRNLEEMENIFKKYNFD